MKPSPRTKKAGELWLDRWTLARIAEAARRWCPPDCAFSAFLSEIATVPWLRKYLP